MTTDQNSGGKGNEEVGKRPQRKVKPLVVHAPHPLIQQAALAAVFRTRRSAPKPRKE